MYNDLILNIAGKSMAVFNFENRQHKSVSSTVWDIAIVAGAALDTDDSAAIYTVTNSGNYGENTFILPLGSGRNEESYEGENISIVQQVCFRKGETDLSPYQNYPDNSTPKPVVNPF